MNRYNFSKAAVDAALAGNNPPNFMKKYNFQKKRGKLYFEGKVVIPNEERDEYLRTELYKNKSELPTGRDSLFHILKQKTINISKRDIETFLKSQKEISVRKPRVKQEHRKFVTTVKRAGIVSGALVHIRPEDQPSEYLPSRQQHEKDTEYKPGDDVDVKKIWKGVRGDYYMYNVVDLYTSYLVTEIVSTKNENVVAKATKTLLARMNKALGVPVREMQLDQGTEFNKSVKDLKLKGVRVRRMVTNALVEAKNAQLQRTYYTIVAQKKAGFMSSIKQSVIIANNTRSRKLGMTPNEAVALLKKGEAVKRRDGAHPRPILKKRAYPVGTVVRALVKLRSKVTMHKAYKGKHWGPPQRITHVQFYQGYPKYTLDNVKHTKMENTRVLKQELTAKKEKLKNEVGDAAKNKLKEDIKSLQRQIAEIRRGAVSKLKWHDQLTLSRDVDKVSEEIVKKRNVVHYGEAEPVDVPPVQKSQYLPGMAVWVHVKGTKYEGKVRHKTDLGWLVKYRASKDAKAYKVDVSEDSLEMALKPGVDIWYNKREAKIRNRDGDRWIVRWKDPQRNNKQVKGPAEQNEITLRL